MGTTHLTLLLRVLFLALVTFSSTAHAGSWWNDEWTTRRKITVDTKAGGIGEPIGSAAMLIRLTEFSAAKEDGGDIRFVAEDDKTVLSHHIEKYDALMGEALVWVKVPDVKPGAQTSFWLYHGNAGPKAVLPESTKPTYDADTVLVYHFAQGSPLADASGSGNNGEGTAVATDGAMIGFGLRLTGKNGVTIPPSPSLAWTAGGSLTWSVWLKPGATQDDGVIFSRREGSNTFVVGVRKDVPYVEVNGQPATAAAPLTAGTWQHLAVTLAASTVTVYVNGEAGAPLSAALPALNSPAFIGGDAAANDVPFTGDLDELQISRIARPAGLIKLAALGQGGEKAAALLVVTPDEQPTNWLSWMKSGTFGIILGSLTFDGWLVIGILAVMAVISWYVMYTKVNYLNGISKGNALFMKEWQHVAADLTVIDDGGEDDEKSKTLGGRVDKAGQKAMRNASVYRIYHIGVAEIRRRLLADRKAGLQRGLAGRSIQAIRASLDGGLVRETQKINSLIVLLTICISGGPFLGLLGTVIGVMITFASVAAAGEVNVNAIAPGIAAALLATVAGLAVAIPALFGYNYILSRVKDAKDDMHIFIDEFVTKMAEFYKERNDAPQTSPARAEALSESAH